MAAFRSRAARRYLALLALALGVRWLAVSPLGPWGDGGNAEVVPLVAAAGRQRSTVATAEVLALVPPGPPACAAAGTTAADGVLPGAGASPWDDHRPGIANLDPTLLAGLREAAREAARYGILLTVTSGWRSPQHQERLLCEAVAEHGSLDEAARWVAPAGTSLHVTGSAVDVGPSSAYEWLAVHGSRFDLCPVYRNEPWHFELRPGAAEQGCPPPYRDPTQDPRL
jgi:D-alanyl-D-alanine carboxypeptidase